MKLEYQAIKLRRGDKWHCNFCSFERERSLTATYKIVSYNCRACYAWESDDVVALLGFNSFLTEAFALPTSN